MSFGAVGQVTLGIPNPFSPESEALSDSVSVLDEGLLPWLTVFVWEPTSRQMSLFGSPCGRKTLALLPVEEYLFAMMLEGHDAMGEVGAMRCIVPFP